MSFEPIATVVAPLLVEPVTSISDTIVRHVHYLTRFKHNHNSLEEKMSDLQSRRDDVKTRIENEEASHIMKRTSVVARWLEKVETLEKEVVLILEDRSRQIQQRCWAGYSPKSRWSRYKLGKKVCKKLKLVEELISEAEFPVIADKLPPSSQVLVIPQGQTFGIDKIFREVWSCLEDEAVTVIGIYGMGGVGKTTLLKKINNNFKEETNKFNRVIWVVVSKEQSNLENIQKKIGKELGLPWSEDDEQTKRAQLIFNVLSKERFVLLLDDVWEPMDLEAIGIPSRHTSSSDSKLVFTTRSESVCVATEVNKKFKVPGLDPKQAWELFQQKVGHDVVNSDSEILELAQKVAGECCGLPLALITIGSAMATKKTPQEWRHAITMLKRYTAEFPGMEKVFSILKFSYDSLVDDTARNCYLYCSLFPEDCCINVEFIIYLWISEGFLDRFKDLNEAIEKGHEVIGSLKAACLLEIGDQSVYSDRELSVKMHDVLRDLALWIARECGKNENKYLVEAGFGLQAPSFKCWKDAERISVLESSLLKSSISELDGTPECPHLLTVLVGETLILGNSQIRSISDDFFSCMPNLRVLDLSFTYFANLPRSIGCLLQLRYLNLSNSQIKSVPDELGDLGKLQFLDLTESKVLKVPSGLISRLSRLQVLRLPRWDRLDDVSMAEELESLDQLRELEGAITKFPIILMSKRLKSCIRTLYMEGCEGLTELGLFSLFRETGKLLKLVLASCSELEKININCLEGGKDDMGSRVTLESLSLWGLASLKNVTWGETASHLQFKHLAAVDIFSCNGLKDMSWLVLAPALRKLSVRMCREVEDIILESIAFQNQTVFSALVVLRLENLPKLKCIIGAALPSPCFTSLSVIGCPFLERMPFQAAATDNKGPRLCRIDGDAGWWNQLNGDIDDDEIAESDDDDDDDDDDEISATSVSELIRSDRHDPFTC